jgi:hypothetical protein
MNGELSGKAYLPAHQRSRVYVMDVDDRITLGTWGKNKTRKLSREFLHFLETEGELIAVKGIFRRCFGIG